jgi:hypothetical protein
MFSPQIHGHYLTDEPIMEVFAKTIEACPDMSADKLAKRVKIWQLSFSNRSKGPSGALLDKTAVWVAYSLIMRGYRGLKDMIVKDPDHYLIWDANRTYGRCMFSTEKAYIGLGPKTMQPGDCVVLFEGGTVPHVLRRNGAEFTFIGECYVHGAIQGELFDSTKSKRMWLT